jgi:hypothetical protein
MDLLGRGIWWTGNLLLAVLLYRAWKKRVFSRYPYFFGYLVLVAGSTVTRLCLWSWTSLRSYEIGYWSTEFLSGFAGFAVTWQIYETVLAPYGGVRRMARAISGVFFALVLARAIVELTGGPIQNLGLATVDMERNLRFVQSLLLLAMAALALHYKLPLGSNVRAMLGGYGLYIGCVVIALSLRSEWGDAFERGKDYLQRSSYLVTLGVWCVGMWSYHPNQVLNHFIESDYERLSEQTSRAFGRLRQHVLESWRP